MVTMPLEGKSVSWRKVMAGNLGGRRVTWLSVYVSTAGLPLRTPYRYVGIRPAMRAPAALQQLGP